MHRQTTTRAIGYLFICWPSTWAELHLRGLDKNETHQPLSLIVYEIDSTMTRCTGVQLVTMLKLQIYYRLVRRYFFDKTRFRIFEFCKYNLSPSSASWHFKGRVLSSKLTLSTLPLNYRVNSQMPRRTVLFFTAIEIWIHYSHDFWEDEVSKWHLWVQGWRLACRW